jgi:PIF1-like helicase
LDGPGGSGKSEVLKQIMVYAKEFCALLEVPFTRSTILVTAWTGVAATLINGGTTFSALKLGKSGSSDDEEQEKFKTVRLVIIDKVSMITVKTLKSIDDKLRHYGRVGSHYGGFNIVFAGDFRQLEPIDKTNSIYRNASSPYWSDAINSHVELKGQYRFMGDQEWGETLSRFHKGEPLPSDFDKINQRVVQSDMTTLSG